jgi:hypothetical protein
MSRALHDMSRGRPQGRFATGLSTGEQLSVEPVSGSADRSSQPQPARSHGPGTIIQEDP